MIDDDGRAHAIRSLITKNASSLCDATCSRSWLDEEWGAYIYVFIYIHIYIYIKCVSCIIFYASTSDHNTRTSCTIFFYREKKKKDTPLFVELKVNTNMREFYLYNDALMSPRGIELNPF